jgi:transposase-like protein
MKEEKFDFESFSRKAGELLRQGKPFTGKDGVFTPLLKRILEASLEGELDEHLQESRKSGKNRRNGHSTKNLKSSLGAFEIFAPRDRNATFEPQTIPKHQRSVNEEIDNKILSLYGLGMSYADIRSHLLDMYGVDFSDGTLTAITDRIIPAIKEWQNRPLESVYPVIWLDAMHFKVRHEGMVKSRAVYSVLGITAEGGKEVIGIYFGDNESSTYWRQVLGDLKMRGVQDICIACIDNLKGFADAIEDVYPKTQVQLCLVHQMRNSMKYLTHKDMSPCVADLKKIYQANNEEMALVHLQQAEEKWNNKYAVIFKSWRANWDRLAIFFQYPAALRKIIYTTNPVESYHRMVRKVTKTKGAFSSEDAIIKQIYLATVNCNIKWQGQIPAWADVRIDLNMYFGDRLAYDTKF